ncbi:putative glutamine amidotransferase [Bradyrhizobium sp. USDA 4449]
MHNGQIGGWQRLRRALEAHIPDDHYASRHGTTDSEVIFLLLLAFGFASDVEGAFAAVIDLIEQQMASSAVNEPLRLTAAMSDGEKLYAIRYASDLRPPTLYVNTRGSGRDALIVSEPIDDANTGWDSVPPQSFLRIDSAGIAVSPFRRS